MKLGEKLKMLREYLEKTQKEFAELLGLSHQFLGGIEVGRSQITPSTALLIEKVYGVNPDWLLGDSGIIFTDPEKMLEYLKNKGRLENRDEILFIAEYIKIAWELPPYITAEWACNIINAFFYLHDHIKIKNLDRIVDLKNVSYPEKKSIEDVLKDIEDKKGKIDRAEIGYIPDRFYDLFLEGEFKLTQEDCKNISDLLTPWCFLVVLRGIKKKNITTKIPYIDTSIFSTPPPSAPERISLQDRISIQNGSAIFHGFITKEGLGGYIEIKDKADLGINEGKDLYDFISLFEPKGSFEDYKYGDWILTDSGIHKQSVLILLTREELKNLKELAGSIKKRKDILHQITLEYVEKYGAV